MKPDAFLSLTYSELRTFGLENWTVNFTRAHRYAARTVPARHTFQFSYPFIRSNPKNVCLDAVRHEIAHALLDRDALRISHGPLWQLLAIALEARPSPAVLPEALDPRSYLRIHCSAPSCPAYHCTYKVQRKPRGIEDQTCRVCKSPIAFTRIPAPRNQEV